MRGIVSAAGGPGGRLCYDALALQASVHILRKYASVQFKLPSSQGRFRPVHARLIEDYIEQNISRNITLEELANICNSTPVQFAQLLEQALGASCRQCFRARRFRCSFWAIVSWS